MGLNWCYCFNQEEGVKCFEEALKHDPHCVMAHWGAVYAFGPFYNYLWRDHSAEEAQKVLDYAHHHLRLARDAAETAIETENTLIKTLTIRFQKTQITSQAEYDAWDDAYAIAMRELYNAHPEDLDITALFIEAMMIRTAWNMWDARKKQPPPEADTLEALDVLENAINHCQQAGRPQHPAILHWHIHALEMSEMLERALHEVLRIPQRPQLASTMEGYYSMHVHVLVRFGKWQEIIEESLPDDPALYPVSIAMMHYAKTIAYASLHDFPKAGASRAAFYAACAYIPEDPRFFNNAALTLLAIAESMLEGELAYHPEYFDAAFTHLRKAVERDDLLAYNEPWAWMHPPRYALAALLSEQGHYAEAEAVYRADLGLNDQLFRCAQHPNNVWALHGPVECLRQRGDTTALPALEEKLTLAREKTDISITSSCLCRGIQP